MKRWLWLLVLALFILHQDFWWWDNDRLVLGFIPVGLAYHVFYSIVAAGVWGLAIVFSWPDLGAITTDQDEKEPGA